MEPEILEIALLYPEVCRSIIVCVERSIGRIRQGSSIISVDDQYVGVHVQACKKKERDQGHVYEVRIGVENNGDDDIMVYNECLLDELLDVVSSLPLCGFSGYESIVGMHYTPIMGTSLEHGYVWVSGYYSEECDEGTK